MHILWWIIMGLIAGWGTGKIMKGSGHGTLVDIIVGIEVHAAPLHHFDDRLVQDIHRPYESRPSLRRILLRHSTKGLG